MDDDLPLDAASALARLITKGGPLRLTIHPGELLPLVRAIQTAYHATNLPVQSAALYGVGKRLTAELLHAGEPELSRRLEAGWRRPEEVP